MKMKRLSGFSLMEMMVVLLIIAVVAAASAPMISKKMINSAAQNSSPWVWTGTTNAIAFNINNKDEQTVTIGAAGGADAAQVSRNARLYIKTASKGPQIAFEDNYKKRSALTISNSTVALTSEYVRPDFGNITAFGIEAKAAQPGVTVIGYKATAGDNKGATAIGCNATAKGERSIAIGTDSKKVGNTIHSLKSEGTDSIAIGSGAQAAGPTSIAIGQTSARVLKAGGLDSIAIGNGAQATGTDGIAVGYQATAVDNCVALGDSTEATTYATAVGNSAKATATQATAIGYNTKATATQATAIGYNTTADVDYSTAIGYGANTSSPTSSGCTKQIVLGDANTEVYIPGTLVPTNLDLSKISGTITLGNSSGKVYIPGNLIVAKPSYLYVRERRAGLNDAAGIFEVLMCGGAEEGLRIEVDWRKTVSGLLSDRRLKNVGEEITTGLDKIKELKVYNYTFKDDTEKTSFVGVIAQDLQKVFPNAVTKGEDGYLRIRWEDMFYSMVNAIKELDAKFEALVVKVQKAIDLEEEVKALRAENKELKKQFSDLEKRIEKLEKKAEKRAKKAEKE